MKGFYYKLSRIWTDKKNAKRERVRSTIAKRVESDVASMLENNQHDQFAEWIGMEDYEEIIRTALDRLESEPSIWAKLQSIGIRFDGERIPSPICANCPIARYLKLSGVPNAWVSLDYACNNGDSRFGKVPLPNRVRSFVLNISLCKANVQLSE